MHIHHKVDSRSIPTSYYRNLCHLKESQLFTENIWTMNVMFIKTAIKWGKLEVLFILVINTFEVVFYCTLIKSFCCLCITLKVKIDESNNLLYKIMSIKAQFQKYSLIKKITIKIFPDYLQSKTPVLRFHGVTIFSNVTNSSESVPPHCPNSHIHQGHQNPFCSQRHHLSGRTSSRQVP